MNAAARHLLDSVREAMGQAVDEGLAPDDAVSIVLRHVLGTTFLTPAELAMRWKCTTGHLANQRVAGDGPAYTKTGRGKASHVLYRLADIEAYEAGQTFASTTEAGQVKAA